MRRLLTYTLFSGSLVLTLSGGSNLVAQTPSGGQPQSAPQTQRPDTTSPGSNNPNNPNAGMNNPDAGTGSRATDDKKFVKDAALGGMTEVELGKLAAQKGSADNVKQFGQKMVDDHTKANDQLKEAATKSKIEIPSSLDSKHQSRVDKLSKLSGPAFDKAYIKDQLKDHQKDVNDFQSEAQGGSDPNVKQFAASTLPTLQEHLNMVKDLNKKPNQ